MDDEDRQARFWRHRPDGFAVKKKEHIIYILEFKRVSDTGERYVSETQKLAEIQHLTVTQVLKKLFQDTYWTVEQLSFVEGHKSVSASVWHDLLLKFGISTGDGVKIMRNLGRTLLDEPENLFRSYWGHRLGVSDGLLQILGHSVRVKTRRSKAINSKTLKIKWEHLYIYYFIYFNIVVTFSNLSCMYIMIRTIVEVHTSSNSSCMYIMMQKI